jgi:hypothetical protein
VREVRRGGPRLFVTAALASQARWRATTCCASAIAALVEGADAVLCTRRLAVVELLASEEVP